MLLVQIFICASYKEEKSMGFTYKAKFRYHWEFGPINKSGIDIPVNAAHVTGTPKAVDFSSNRDISILTGLDAARRAKGVALFLPLTIGAPPGNKSVLPIHQALDDLQSFLTLKAEFFFSFSILKYSNGAWVEAQILREDAASFKGFLVWGASLGNGLHFSLPSAKIINASPNVSGVLQKAVAGVFQNK
jgi:hypothetical protein